MFLFKTKLTATLGAAFAAALTFGPASPAEAAPPEGMRWIDTVQRTSPRRPSPPARVGPVVGYPRFYSYPPVATAPVAAPQTPTTATVSVRGPDGVVRTYPVEGPVVQRTAPAVPGVAYPCR